MPKVNVQGFGTVNFPDSMSHEQIQQAIEKDVLPQMQSAQDINAQLKSKNITPPGGNVPAPVTGIPAADTPIGNFKQGAEYGLSDMALGGKQFLGLASRADADKAKAQEAPTLNTLTGKLGYYGAQIAPTLMIPLGAVGDATAALPKALGMSRLGALLGTRWADYALTGGLLGAAQPVGIQGSRLGNAAIGATGASIIPAAGKVLSSVKTIAAPFTEGGRARMVGNELLSHIKNPQAAVGALTKPNNYVLNSQPTTASILADQTQEPGLLPLERVMRSKASPAFATRDMENNAARHAVIEDIAKTQQDLDAAIAARDEKAGPIRESALSKAKPIDTGGSVIQMLDGLINKAVDPKISGPLQQVRASYYKALAANGGKGDANAVYDVRKMIDSMLDPKLNSEFANAKNAGRQLVQVKNAITDQLNKSTGGKFGKYLETYKELSKPVNRLQQAQDFQSKFQNAQPDLMGRPMITPYPYRKALTNSDLADTLNYGDYDALQDLGKDLNRSSLVNTVKPAGSDTFQNLKSAEALGAIIGGRTAGSPFLSGFVRRPLSFMLKPLEEKSNQLLLDALMNPEAGAGLLKNVMPNNPALLQRLRHQAVMRSLTGAGALGSIGLLSQ